MTSGIQIKSGTNLLMDGKLIGHNFDKNQSFKNFFFFFKAVM